MNSDFVTRQAKALAARLATPEKMPSTEPANALGSVVGVGVTTVDVDIEHVPSDEERITRAYLLLYGREVTNREIQLGLEFLEAARERTATSSADVEQPEHTKEDDSANSADEPEPAWVQYARALMSANELRFVS